MKQLDLLQFNTKNAFGGSLGVGKRHDSRPLTTKDPIHIVLRASGNPRLRRQKTLITNDWRRFAKRFGLLTYRFALCGNHLHALVRLHDRRGYVRFVRAFTGTLARRFGIKWEVRPFTRLVGWGRTFARAAAYVVQNFQEAEGYVAYKPRKSSGRRSSATG